MIEILAPGPLSTVQDLGRTGHAALGVPGSGAADLRSFRLANRLVGNQESAAAVEMTLGGLRARFTAPATVALTGAPCPVTAGGRRTGPNGPVHIAAGEELRVGLPERGLRTYLAVRGGLDVPPVLGSRATDLLSGLGPAPLSAGDLLPVGRDTAGWPLVDVAPVATLPDEPVLRVLPGPRDDWFTPGAPAALCSTPYEVTADSNRVGLRLSGPPLKRVTHRELPSEGIVRGALQIPPDGHPVLFLADHPVTGGYPVVAVVAEADLDLAAQLRPGARLRFRLARRK